jgi:hypothetical protein
VALNDGRDKLSARGELDESETYSVYSRRDVSFFVNKSDGHTHG